MIALSGLFTALEIAFFAMDELDFLTAVHAKHKNANKLLKLKKEKDNLLFGILIFNNTTNITASALNVFLSLELAKIFDVRPELMASIATIVFAVVVIIFAEAVPKVIGLRVKYDLCLSFASFLLWVNYLTAPLSKSVLVVVNLFERLKSSFNKTNPDVFQKAFIGFTEKSTKEGLIGQNESEVIRNVMALNRYVMTIMRPRNQIFAMESDMSIEKALPIMMKQMFSRVPIFLDDLDNINGVVHVRDMFTSQESELQDKKLNQIAAQPIFVRDTWTIWNVLNTLRREKSHLGVVVDEFGGVRGIITLEDILEELVGDILDEKDVKKDPELKQISDNKWIASGSIDIYSLKKHLLLQFDENGDYETLQGFVMHQLKKIPRINDFVTHLGIWRFTVKEMLKNEIKLVEIVRESTRLEDD
ncbi:MAG: HlyC/CorC family transporter [SAR324 cluster bacterium]|nr:HlyC/CorC family transporter [SAR324 cluster bacterium]